MNGVWPGDRVRLLLTRKPFGKGKLKWSDKVHTVIERVEGGNRFIVSDSEVPYKYSDLQLVGANSQDVKPKAAATIAAEEKRAHALALGRTGLARGVRASKALIDEVAAMPAERPARERRAPVRLVDEPPRPQLATTRTRAARAIVEAPTYEVEGIVHTRKKGRVMQYLVKWKGYGWDMCTWEPRGSFDGGPDSYPVVKPPEGYRPPA